MASKQDDKKSYVYLHDRLQTWHNWLELVPLLIGLAFVLFIAIAWTGGFWQGLWYALWHIG